MRFPGQAALEARVLRAEAALEESRRLLATLVEQNASLVAQLAAMKRDGFDAPPPVKLEPVAPRFPAKVMDAISQRASPRSREWAMLESFAAEALGKGNEVDAVAADILAGEDPDEL